MTAGTHHCGESGFSLLEVLIAIFFTAFAFGALLPALSDTYRRTSETRAMRNQLFHVRDVLDRVLSGAEGAMPASGTAGGFHWSADTVPQEGGEGEAGGGRLHSVTVTLFSDADRTQALYSLQTLRRVQDGSNGGG